MGFGRQYSIWNEINSCAYTNGNKSYGVHEHSSINMKVGSGSKNSHHFCTIEQTKKQFGDWLSFRLKVDGKVIKQSYYNKKTKEYTERKPIELMIEKTMFNLNK